MDSRAVAWKRSLTGFAFVLPGFIVFMLFMGVPTIQSFFFSFTQWSGIGPKVFIGLDNYIEILSRDFRFRIAFQNNLLWAIGAYTVPVWIGLILANSIVRGPLKKTKAYQVIFFMPQIVSMVAAAIIWQWMYNPFYGPINRVFLLVGLERFSRVGWLGEPNLVLGSLFVIYVWKSFGFATVVFVAALQGVDYQLYDAAEIDGCSRWGQFWHITYPGIYKTQTTVIMLMVIWSFRLFDLIRTTTQGGPGFRSMVIGYYVYYHGFVTGRTGYATAVSVIMCILMLVFSRSFIYFRERNE